MNKYCISGTFVKNNDSIQLLCGDSHYSYYLAIDHYNFLNVECCKKFLSIAPQTYFKGKFFIETTLKLYKVPDDLLESYIKTYNPPKEFPFQMRANRYRINKFVLDSGTLR